MGFDHTPVKLILSERSLFVVSAFARRLCCCDPPWRSWKCYCQKRLLQWRCWLQYQWCQQNKPRLPNSHGTCMVTKKRNSISTTLFRVAKQNYYQTTQGLYKYILWVQWPSGYFPKHTSHQVSVPLKRQTQPFSNVQSCIFSYLLGLSGFLHWQNQTEIAWPKNWTLQGNYQ